jgi:hypothetical protein
VHLTISCQVISSQEILFAENQLVAGAISVIIVVV